MCKIILENTSIYFSHSASADLSTMKLVAYSTRDETANKNCETESLDCEAISESIMRWF